MQEILEAIRAAKQVGNVRSSMQTPDLREDVLTRARAGHTEPAEVLLEIYEGAGNTRQYTLGELQNARRADEDSWLLASGETLWIY